ncbi:hypothetical protein TNCV_4689891 [Trichonephila clavipes]|nr:hypothetical protein TNCV_4689891 [Trichonephila clavipes]
MRQLIAATPDNPNRNAVETGSNNRWNNQAFSSVLRGTDPMHRFQSRGYYGQQHQYHMDNKVLDQVPDSPQADLKRLFNPAMFVEVTVPKQTNLTSGYWHIKIHEKDAEKLDFTTNFGLYEWLKLPFGWKNSPAVFQRTIRRILQK